MANNNYFEIEKSVFRLLSPRTQKVLRERFGLENTEKKTLESIGRDFGVTRERIRQIEEAGLEKLRKQKLLERSSAIKQIVFYLEKRGRVAREDLLLEDLGGKDNKAEVLFFLVLAPQFERSKISKETYPFWELKEGKITDVQGIIKSVIEQLEEENHSLSPTDIVAQGIINSINLLLSCLQIARQIEKGINGDFGLIEWPEVKPKKLKDKAYLVFKEKNAPLHFTEVARLINHFMKKWDLEKENQREALVQTIHNELIRDDRFVLIGRGLYALREWGYESGTVENVIARVLRGSKRLLSADEIIEKVLERRLVKRSTILLNLNRGNQFIRNQKGSYQLKSTN
jgi:hypothetical protein